MGNIPNSDSPHKDMDTNVSVCVCGIYDYVSEIIVVKIQGGQE